MPSTSKDSWPKVWDRAALITCGLDSGRAEALLRGSYHSALDGTPVLVADDLERSALAIDMFMEVES